MVQTTAVPQENSWLPRSEVDDPLPSHWAEAVTVDTTLDRLRRRYCNEMPTSRTADIYSVVRCQLDTQVRR